MKRNTISNHLKLSALGLLAFALPTSVSAQQSVETTQFVNIDLLGLHYNYELPIAHQTSLGLHTGLTSAFGYKLNGGFIDTDSFNSFAMRYNVGAELRCYYNLETRKNAGKNVSNNSANFAALSLDYYTPGIIEHNSYVPNSLFAVTPYWGLRRTVGDWLFEGNAGISVGVSNSDWEVGPKLNAKVGYIF